MWQPPCKVGGVENVTTATMKPRTATTTSGRRNRILIVLAAGWMILSLAVGGAVSADPNAGGEPPARAAAEQAAQP
jgi:hypothetical protein